MAMEMPNDNVLRISSCRGVSFEIRPPRGLSDMVGSEDGDSRRQIWLSWMQGNSGRVFPMLPELSLSRSPSSHYCDLHSDEEDNNEKETLSAPPVEKLAGDIEKQERRMEAHEPRRVPKETRIQTVLLHQGLLTVYNRLFAFSFAVNVVTLVLAIVGLFSYAKRKAALFAMYNILALVLCRSEAFLRLVFWMAVKALGRPWVPLRVKTVTTAFLQSLGGIHSGCGISSVAWLVYALVLTLNHRSETSSAIIAVASTILSLLALSCIAALPFIRHVHHNVFERTHRFTGWGALALLWVFVTLTVGYNPKTNSYDRLNGSRLVKTQELWITSVITLAIFLPWITVKRVPVSISSPSGHASIIKFAGGVKSGILGRISRSPLSEWHAFGIISDGKDSHMILAGAVGDFTKRLVSEPPRHLWVRGVGFAGLPYLVNMYNRVVLVATGSGICVFLSFLLQPCAADVCVVWVTKGVERNFGQEIKEMLSGHPKEKVIVYDTELCGRVNLVEMTVDAAKRWEAEAVVVTSNPKGSTDVVRACKRAGIAVFGPTWDS